MIFLSIKSAYDVYTFMYRFIKVTHWTVNKVKTEISLGKKAKEMLNFYFLMYTFLFTVFFFPTALKYSIKKNLQVNLKKKKKGSPSDADEQSVQKTTD